MNDILDELWETRHQKDVLFLSIIEGYNIIKESKEYIDRIFYMKAEHMLIDHDLKRKHTYINYELLWSVFESKFSLNYRETRNILKYMLETHLNLQETTVLYTRGLSLENLGYTIKFNGNDTFKLLV